MPIVPHIEKHFTASETVRDVVMRIPVVLGMDFCLWPEAAHLECLRIGRDRRVNGRNADITKWALMSESERDQVCD